MRNVGWRLRICSILVLLIASLVLIANEAAAQSVDESMAEPIVETVDIVAADGSVIPAFVTKPATAGPHPLIVAPASWGSNRIQYLVPSYEWAKLGFVTVSFTARGFSDSEQEIDIAGPMTVRDVSDVIDWAVDHAGADESRVGAMGISYGGGIALLAAGNDDRIGAVVSMAGWANLEDSLYPNETISSQAGDLLLLAGFLTGRPGPFLEAVLEARTTGNIEPIAQGFAERAPMESVGQVNANGTAVMIQHAWNDGLFPPSEAVRYFDALAGPRKLIIAPGDHGTTAIPGLLGLPNQSYDEALRWMQRHVAGEQVATGPGVLLVSNNDFVQTTGASWADVEPERRVFSMGEPTQPSWPEPQTGQLTETPADVWPSSGQWFTRILGGFPSDADSGPVLLSGTLQAFGVPQTVITDWVNREVAAVWETPKLSSASDIVGSPSLHVDVVPSHETTSIFGYLYEERSDGVAELITHKPITLRNAVPGEVVRVDLDFEPTSWQVAAGSKLVLALDTIDLRYQSETDIGFVGFGSTVERPAQLTIPMN